MSTPALASQAQISLLPRIVNLALYSGDGAAIKLTLTNPDDTPYVPPDGVMLAQVRRFREDTRVLATFTIDATDAADGILVLQLTGQDTANIGKGGVWDLQLTPTGAEPVTLVTGDVTCRQDVSRP